MNEPIAPDILTQQCLRLGRHLLNTLPADIAARLKHSRKVIRHQTHGTWMFEIWDRHQNALLPKSHFKYCVVYDPAHRNNPRHNAYFHAWLNKVRIYRDRTEIVDRLEREIRALALPGLKIGIRERAISIGREFDWPTDGASLTSVIAPPLTRLIQALHPLLIPIIDQLAANPAPDGDRAPRPSLAGERRSPPSRDYTRSIPPTWRIEILESQNHRCAACGADLRQTGHHIDHIIPFARGGGSGRENLQALCPDCNLRKGARLPHQPDTP